MMVLVLPRELEKTWFTRLKNSTNYEKPFRLTKYNWGNALDYMDLFIHKVSSFYTDGKLSISIHQKETNKFMYIPYRSFHQRHTIKNYVWGELKRYVRYNTEEKKLQNTQNTIFSQIA